jgi:hypothetical protein
MTEGSVFMTRGFLLTAAVVMLAGPAFAQFQDKCSAPIAPVVPDGKTAAVPQLSQAANDVKNYIKASDDYQACLLAEINTYETEAKGSKQGIDPSIRKTLEAKGDANQKDKERLGAAYNKSVGDYRAAHPK